MPTTNPLRDWRPRAVVFDCDGLLMDTEPCWTIAETELYRRRGIEFTDEHKEQVIGTAILEEATIMAGHFGEAGSEEAIARELHDAARAVLAVHSKPMPGAADIVNLIAAKVPVAVASNSERVLVTTALAPSGIDHLLPLVVAGDEVPNPKPAPDIYEAACERLGFAPADCLAFEDSQTGVRAAVAAGLKTVAVPTFAGHGDGADVVFGSLLDPELVAWIEDWA
jgi:HAD superfamily hydrolase (TIGR01509 family)